MSDAAKLQFIEDYDGGLRRLCNVVAREQRTQNGKTVEALVDVARTTVHHLRLSALSYGENLINIAGASPTDDKLQRECLEMVRGGTDCAALWRMEEELRIRLKKPPGWSNKLMNMAKSGLQVVQEGGMYVLKTVKNMVLKVFRSLTEVMAYMMPYIMRLVSYVFADPRTALWSLITAKSLQRVICRQLSQTYMQLTHVLPEGFFDNNLSNIVKNQSQYLKEFGENFGVSAVMRGLVEKGSGIIASSGSKLVDSTVTMLTGTITGASLAGGLPSLGMSTIAGAAAVGLVHLTGAFVKSCIEVTADMTKDALEYASYRNDFDNAFTRLFEIISFQECFKEWRKAIIRVSDVDQFSKNRTAFVKSGKDAYKKERREQLKKKEGVEENTIEDVINDEIQMFSQSKQASYSNRTRRRK